MHVFADLLHWFTDGAHWSGNTGVPFRVLQHVELSAVAVALASLVALPLGLFIGHTGRFSFLVISVANLGRAIPSFAILSIVYQLMLNYTPSFAFGFGPTVIALWVLAIPPILTNTYVGVQGVDQDTVEAARGMGMRESEVLTRLELPLAAPLILAGLRTAAVQVVATATLAALIAGGGLGRYIIDGLHNGDNTTILAGAILVALLAVVTELGMGALERAVTPKTMSKGRHFPAEMVRPGLGPARVADVPLGP